MRRNHICPGQWFVAVLLLAIGLSTYGCKDSVSVSEDVEVPLASLSITPGTLRPAFFSNTTSYVVDAPTSATSVTVTATPKDSTTTMMINGIPTLAGQGRSVTLGQPGSTTTITIVLEAPNGTETTYTVTVTRLLSGVNDLSNLTVVPGTLSPSPFDANTLDYTVDVQTSVPSVTITATKSDANATMLIGSVTVPAGTNPGQAPITLGTPGTITPVLIEVTAPNGSKKTYNLSIKRLSGDTNLLALNVTANSLTHPVDLNTPPPYTVNVATDVISVDVSATKSDPNAVMAIGSVTVPAGTVSGSAFNIPLGAPGSDTPILIIVTAQNGVDSKTHTVTVHRAAPSSNNNLASLDVIPGSLVPSFAPSIVDYTVDVATNDNSVTVTATLQDVSAIMLINGQGISSGQPREISPLQPPGSDTIIEIVVRAQNGVENPYRITVRRPLPSSNANLSELSVTPGSLDQPFDTNVLAYTVTSLPIGIVLITATKSDPNATMSAFGSVIAPPGTPTGTAPVVFSSGTMVEITVIAQDAVTSKIYSITFNPPTSPP